MIEKLCHTSLGILFFAIAMVQISIMGAIHVVASQEKRTLLDMENKGQTEAAKSSVSKR